MQTKCVLYKDTSVYTILQSVSNLKVIMFTFMFVESPALPAKPSPNVLLNKEPHCFF